MSGVLVLEPAVHGDNRGYFLESYNQKQYEAMGVRHDFIQDNHSFSAEVGTLRGLHYQLNPMAQTKLIRVISGEIYDVVVDIRRDSPTFGQWEGFQLSGENQRQLLIPAGFAHGFCTVTANTHVIYKVDQYYSAAHDRGIRYDDPELNIPWPTERPVLSSKDSRHPSLAHAEIDFLYKGASGL